jgi:hypothetical protein
MSRNSQFRADRRSVAFSYERYAVKRPHKIDGLAIALAGVLVLSSAIALSLLF